MSVILSSLECKVEGLKAVYISTERDACFAFENQAQKQKACDKIAEICRITNGCLSKLRLAREEADKRGALDLLSCFSIVPENEEFAFGISAKPSGTVGTVITSSKELIERVANVLTTEEMPMKNVPIIPLN